MPIPFRPSIQAIIRRKVQGSGFPMYRVALIPSGLKRVRLDGFWWEVVNAV